MAVPHKEPRAASIKKFNDNLPEMIIKAQLYLNLYAKAKFETKNTCLNLNLSVGLYFYRHGIDHNDTDYTLYASQVKQKSS